MAKSKNGAYYSPKQVNQIMANLTKLSNYAALNDAEGRKDAINMANEIMRLTNDKDDPRLREVAQKLLASHKNLPKEIPQEAREIATQLSLGKKFSGGTLSESERRIFETQFKKLTGSNFADYQPKNITQDSSGKYVVNGQTYDTYRAAQQASEDAYQKSFQGVTDQKPTAVSATNKTQTQTARPYQAGDPNPNTGTPLSALQANNLNKQGAKYTPPVAQQPAQSQQTSQTPGTPGVPTATPQGNAANGTTGGATASATGKTANGNQAGLAVLQGYLDSGAIDAGTFAYFKQALDLFPEGSPVNIDNVLKTFDKLKQTTIDPYWQEQTKIFTDQLQTARKNLETGRKDELAIQEEQANQNIENTQAGLEASGMTFSGAAGKQLGSQSAYGVPGGRSSIPMQAFAEGLVQKQNRISSSSSNARYLDNLNKLQRQAETTLGSSGVSGMFPEVKALGGITGTMTEQKKQAEAAALQGVYNQAVDNYNASQPIQVFQ